MSGGYDNKIVFGSADSLTQSWGANNLVAGNLNAAATLSLNLFGGNSFYLDLIYIQVNGLIWTAGGGFTFTLWNSPNAANITGATAIFAQDIITPTAAPGTPVFGPGTTLQLVGLKYHNNQGRNGFLHGAINANLSGGALKFVVGGGSTALTL